MISYQSSVVSQYGRCTHRPYDWHVELIRLSEGAEAEAEAAFGGGENGEEYTGRCAAILSTGKRCPNASLPGSRYCGIPAHRELAVQEGEAAA